MTINLELIEQARADAAEGLECNICNGKGSYRHKDNGKTFVSICNCADHLCDTCGKSKYLIETIALSTGFSTNYFMCLNSECVQ